MSDYSPPLKPSSPPRAAALLPLLLFLGVFLGSGIYFQWRGTDFAFYQVQAPVAALPAILLSILLGGRRLSASIETFLSGAGDVTIMSMCMIYLLAGAFSSVAQATGGVDATVTLAMRIIPDNFLLPGLFLVGAFISTAMGTSMGTIAALAPIALGIVESAGMSLPLVAGTVLGGAMFGDNLSIISDTTIAATRSQGCAMREKFAENVYIATPAALAALLLLWAMGGGAVTAGLGAVEWLRVFPYVLILVLALAGLNVFAVLTLGLLAAGGLAILTLPDYSMQLFAKDIYGGFTKMQEIFILSMMIGGLGALMKQQGGLAFLAGTIEKLIRRFSVGKPSTAVAELGMAAVVSLTNMCTANNTVAILVTGDLAHDVAGKNGVSPRRAASILDVFACVLQGILPYGAQVLLVASIMGVSPLLVVGKVYYCLFLAIAGVGSIVWTGTRGRRRA